MDISLLVSVILAIVAIVPGVWALVNQAKKDKRQATIDMNKAAQDAAMSIIAPLQTEVARLQGRIGELEQALIDKTNEIGKLMREGIDKDTKILTLEYQVEEMKLRLSAFENKRRSKAKSSQDSDNNIDSKIKEEVKASEIKKQEIREYTQKSIEQITNGSALNKNLEE